MKKKFSARHCGITFLVTAKVHYKNDIINEKRAYRFDGFVKPYTLWKKCAENIVSAQAKKDMQYLTKIEGFRGYSIVDITMI